MRNRKSLGLNIKYAMLQVMFWTSAASAYAYLTQMLQYKGFAEDQIGVLGAVKLFSTVVFQVIIGAFSDKYAKKIPLKIIISVLSAASLVLTFIFYKYKLSFGNTILLFVGFGATFTCISPLIDSLSILYVDSGRNINYPLGRAAGSCAWAVACVLFGLFCDRYGANHLLILQMVFVFGMLITALIMDRINLVSRSVPEANEEVSQNKIEERVYLDKDNKVHTSWYLISEYPKYLWFLIGSAIMFMGYNVGTTFLINVFERLGGSNFHFGIAEFVLAISEVPSAFILLKLRNKIPLDRMMLCCAIFMTIKNMFAAFSDSVSVIIISQSCEMLGFGLFYSGSVYLIEEMLPHADVVKGMSLINAATVGVGEGIGSLICGWVNSRYGLTTLMNISVIISTISIFCIIIMCHTANQLPGRKSGGRKKQYLI